MFKLFMRMHDYITVDSNDTKIWHFYGLIVTYTTEPITRIFASIEFVVTSISRQTTRPI